MADLIEHPDDNEENPAQSESEAWQPWQFTRFDAPATPAQRRNDPATAASPAASPQTNSASSAAVAEAAAAELARLREETQARAHAEGHAAGLAEGKQQARKEAQRLSALVGQLDAAMAEFDRQMAEEVLALALVAARQVIQQHIEVHPESLLATLRELLAQVHHPQVLISVHPDDAALLREHLENQPGHEGHRLHEDPRLQRGGCIIEAGGGRIDASIETRWQQVVASLGSDFPWLGEPGAAAGFAPGQDRRESEQAEPAEPVEQAEQEQVATATDPQATD